MESIGYSGKVGGAGVLRSLLDQCLSSSHLHCREPKDVEGVPWLLDRISIHCCCDQNIFAGAEVQVEVEVEVGFGSCSRNLSFHDLSVGQHIEHIGDSSTSLTTNAGAVVHLQRWLG